MDGVTLGLALAGAFILGVLFGRFLAPNRRPWWMEFATMDADARRVLADRYALGDLTAEEYADRLHGLELAQKKPKGKRPAA